MAGQLLAEVILVGRTGNNDTCRSRDNQGWHLGYQTLANGQQCVVGQGDIQGQPLLPDPDDQSTKDIDQHDQDAGDGITTHKLTGTVHGAVEICLTPDLLPADASFLVGQKAGGKISINGHLLARHGIQREAGRHLGHPAGTLGDDHKVNHHQNQKHDRAHHVVAADHEGSERLDHCASGFGTFATVQENQPGAGNVER